MNKIFLIPILLLSISVATFAQMTWGIKGGISSFNVDAESYHFNMNDIPASAELTFDGASFGYHLGLTGMYRGAFWFVQPNALLNTTRTSYKITDIFTETESFLNETTYYLDFPVLLGLRVFGVRAGFGPVAHIFLANQSDFNDLETYAESFQTITTGYQVGIGLDLGHFHIDVNYEKNERGFGEHINLSGENYHFENRPSRIVASIALTF